MDQSLLRMAHPHLHWDASRVAERAEVGIAEQDVVHLGYRYTSAAVVAPETAPPSLDRLALDLDGAPGTRVPHAWVTWRGERRSTLDLVESRFTLLAGPGGGAWCAAAAAAAARAGLDLAAYRVGPDGDAVDPDGAWAAAAGLRPDGALLVRPDGFVAWRTAGGAERPAEVIAAALRQILGDAARLGR